MPIVFALLQGVLLAVAVAVASPMPREDRQARVTAAREALANHLGLSKREGLALMGEPYFDEEGTSWFRFHPTLDGIPLCGVAHVASFWASGEPRLYSAGLVPATDLAPVGAPRMKVTDVRSIASKRLSSAEVGQAEVITCLRPSEIIEATGGPASRVTTSVDLVHEVVIVSPGRSSRALVIDDQTGKFVSESSLAVFDGVGTGLSANLRDQGHFASVPVPTVELGTIPGPLGTDLPIVCLGSETYEFFVRDTPSGLGNVCDLASSFGDGLHSVLEDWLAVSEDGAEVDRDWFQTATAETAAVEAALGIASYYQMLRALWGEDELFHSTEPPVAESTRVLLRSNPLSAPLMWPELSHWDHPSRTLFLFEPSATLPLEARALHYGFKTIGHEMAHGRNISLLGHYLPQWGNHPMASAHEFFSEVFGVALDAWVRKNKGNPTGNNLTGIPRVLMTERGPYLEGFGWNQIDEFGPAAEFLPQHSDPGDPAWQDPKAMAQILNQAFVYMVEGMPRFENDQYVPRSSEIAPWGLSGMGLQKAVELVRRSLLDFSSPWDFVEVRKNLVNYVEMANQLPFIRETVEDAFYAVGIGDRAERDPWLGPGGLGDGLEEGEISYQNEAVAISFLVEDESLDCCQVGVSVWGQTLQYDDVLNANLTFDLSSPPSECIVGPNQLTLATRSQVTCLVDKSLLVSEIGQYRYDITLADGSGRTNGGLATAFFELDDTPPSVDPVVHRDEPQGHGGILEWTFSETEGTKVTRLTAGYFRNGFKATVVDPANDFVPAGVERVRFEILEWDQASQLPIAGPVTLCDLSESDLGGQSGEYSCSYYPDLLQILHGFPLLESNVFWLNVVATDIYANEGTVSFGPFVIDRTEPEARGIWNGGWDRLNNPDFNEINFEFADSTCIQSFKIYSKGRWGDLWQLRRNWDGPSDCRDPNSEPRGRLERLVVEPDAEFFGLDAAYFMVVVNDGYYAERLTYKQVELLREESDEPQCNETIVSGGPEGLEPMVIEMGSPDFSSVVHFQPFEVPDKLRIWQDNKLRFSSGCVANDPDGQINDSWDPTPLALTFDSWPDARDSFIEVEIDGDCDGHDTGTAWEFMVECPVPTP